MATHTKFTQYVSDNAKEIEAYRDEIMRECFMAMKAYPPFNSGHEGWAVIQEEMDELFETIRSRNLDAARREAIQVGAMALRFLIDLPNMRKS